MPAGNNKSSKSHGNKAAVSKARVQYYEIIKVCPRFQNEWGDISVVGRVGGLNRKGSSELESRTVGVVVLGPCQTSPQ